MLLVKQILELHAVDFDVDFIDGFVFFEDFLFPGSFFAAIENNQVTFIRTAFIHVFFGFG